MSRTLAALLAISIAACSESKKADPAPAPPPTTPSDAGISQAPLVREPSPTFVPSEPQPGREGRPIDVTLRSSPPGATVAVDGNPIGTTPAFWSGMADGRPHEFAFEMRGHAIARYRFVPVSSGVIHARLDSIAEEADAGVPPPEVVPPAAPMSQVPPTAPPIAGSAVKPVEPANPGIGPQP